MVAEEFDNTHLQSVKAGGSHVQVNGLTKSA